MRKRTCIGFILAGSGAGAVAGLFGGGGGLILIPLLTLLTDVKEDALFPASIAIILPICAAALAVTALTGTLAWKTAIPYLIGSALGGLLAGKWGRRIPVVWLHRTLGALILWGGVQYLC